MIQRFRTLQTIRFADLKTLVTSFEHYNVYTFLGMEIIYYLLKLQCFF